MKDDKFISVIDFGSSKIRLGIYNDLDNYKFVSEKKCSDNLNNLQESKISETIEEIVIEAEKNTNRHLKNLYVMTDNNSCLSVDISIKKKIDNTAVNKKIVENIIYEIKNIIEKSYTDFNIIHLIISKYILDNKSLDSLPLDMSAECLILEMKFILIKNTVEQDIRNHFKSSHVSVNRIYN